ncbi:hypothetical protein CRN76_00760 [Chryseobacterium indologenes]|uniref:hypothetical protein n=1 Tax=Chryseobacterium indologenes TaxID=253 RepID=UPI000BFCE5D5|nr:hypothetical protein [Chryseobacterium indologenes]ATN04057.1 hypothetical protein CRN76_00760 [Chryseobacterium indologenes]AYY83279.1 hypothetical protein EGX91_01140 [Chryseobacterium indologenes]QIX80185.1 hypothetical protein FOB56_02500 [Chryseobacterium indologenes]UDQ53833.1 hypothetical protein LJF28_20780 [Chryseobacterium indologenes]HAO26649.1 hypothetical protein [Chryseobacterium indologenes]
MRQYHLSYDITDTKDSTQYKEDKEYLFYLLYSLGYNSIYSYADSTIIVEYDEDKIKPIVLFNFLQMNMLVNIQFYISLISRNSQEKPIDLWIIYKDFDPQLNERNIKFQEELRNINWDSLKELYDDGLLK